MANKFYSIKVSRKGKDPRQWIKDVDASIHFELQDRLVEVANEAVKNMQSYIKTNALRKPTTGLLENSITDAELLDTVAGVHIGIGRITNLPRYWEVINDGGYVPPPNIGYFGDHQPPTPGGSGDTWTHTGRTEMGFEEIFTMFPSTPIRPMKYIEVTNDDFLIPRIKQEIARLNRELKQESI
jgi:hypothetical protein